MRENTSATNWLFMFPLPSSKKLVPIVMQKEYEPSESKLAPLVKVKIVFDMDEAGSVRTLDVTTQLVAVVLAELSHKSPTMVFETELLLASKRI